MPAILNNEVFVFTSSRIGLIGVYTTYKSFTENGLKASQKKYLLKSDEEIMISLLNEGEFNFGNGKENYKLQLCKQASNKINSNC